MKNISFVFAIIITLNCMSQKATPPAPVTSAFAKKFPGITVKGLNKEDNKYEANFTQDGKPMSATFMKQK